MNPNKIGTNDTSVIERREDEKDKGNDGKYNERKETSPHSDVKNLLILQIKVREGK